MNGTLPKARALTRSEIKALRAAGLDPAFIEGAITMKKNAELVDWIMDKVYKDTDFSNIPYSACLELSTKTYQLTYRVTEEEEKNS